MSRFSSLVLALLLTAAPITTPIEAQHEHHQHHQPAPAVEPEPEKVSGLTIPDIPVVDQDGRPLRFYTDLVKGRTVAINFVFTTCTTICPPMGATFGKLRQLLGESAGRDAHLISVSVDPGTDTPERLKAWSGKFGAGPGWTLVTGDPEQITRLLKALNAYTANLQDHTPLVLMGNEARGDWTRAYGLAAPAKLADLLGGLAPKQADASGAHRYFGDIPLVNQHGETLRFYPDLIQGRTVIINAMFTSCTGVCPLMSKTFADIQEWLGDRLGKDVLLISMSVDPETDTPAKLKEYAARFGAKPGWHFVTGKKADVDAALTKLGQYAEKPDAHKNLFLIGNDRTGLWKKAFGLAKTEEILPVVASVVDDRGEEGPKGR